MNVADSDPMFVIKLGTAPVLPSSGSGITGLSAHDCVCNGCLPARRAVVPLDFLRVLRLIALDRMVARRRVARAVVLAGTNLIISGTLVEPARRHG